MEQKVVDLKSGIYTADLINTSDIKAISVNVDTKSNLKIKLKQMFKCRIQSRLMVQAKTFYQA